MARSIVLHGHYYQPPREDPWLEQIERQPSAAPFHDWNARIEHECYRAVVAARVLDGEGRIARIVNALAWTSFDFGPTLLEWLEREAPDTYAAVLHADRASAARLGGHGNAMAQAYHHAILPLASRRDKTTEVRWGVADFTRRFGRAPEGMWLPETAVDDETLDVLACEGIRFTVLAQHQVEGAPARGMPGLYRTAGGREIALFVYDGPMSHGIAFGGLLADAAKWEARLTAGLREDGPDEMLAAASDGETYGHHHRFGEMALAAALEGLGADPEVTIENPAAFLARHPATAPVKLVAPSSWSCSHGVERWRSDCGCRTKEGTSQAWRAPLRRALDALAAQLHARFAEVAEEYFPDPWAARDSYATVGIPSHLPVRARELLEMERNALRMFTSCGWFFDDPGGLETIVCLRYAARAIELAGSDGAILEAGLLERLAEARSNDPALGSAREIYAAAVRGKRPGHLRAAAGYAAVRAVAPGAARAQMGVCVVAPADGAALRVRHGRTGAEWDVETWVLRTGATGIEVEAREAGADGPPLRFALDLLPEPEASALRLALRRELRRDVLSAEEEARIAEGVLRFDRAVGEALVRQLPADPREATGLDLDRLERTLDLLALEGQPVPFDAQTRFHHIVTRGPRDARQALAPLARRFGFAGAPGNGR
jgi:hypothetical protein